MSLTALRRMSCTLFPSACGCKPGGAAFCSPVGVQVTRAIRRQNALPTGAVRMLSASPNLDNKEEPEPASFKDRVKVMWKKYGKLAIVTYFGVYVGTLSSLFLALDFGVFNASTFGFDHAAAVHRVCDIYENITGHTELAQYIKDHPTAGTLAVAWLMTKFTEPLRLFGTVMIVPPIARYWSRLTAAKIAEEVQEEMEEKQEQKKKAEEHKH